MTQNSLEIIQQTAATPADNVILDQYYTQICGKEARRIFRTWWGGPIAVVAGCSEKLEQVANLPQCEVEGVPVFKRFTGGGTVVQTPDVLNFSYSIPAPTRVNILEAFRTTGEVLIGALQQFGITAQMLGISDIAVDGRKISGNAQAWKWKSVLVHGTLLVDIDIALIERLLLHPPKEPDYRQGRSHREFLTCLRQLGVTASHQQIEQALIDAAKIYL
ncbi:MAG: lipoate--protein ligase family protein [Armatimonadota bacterium]